MGGPKAPSKELIATAAAFATGQAKSMRKAMILGGYAKSTARVPNITAGGITPSKLLAIHAKETGRSVQDLLLNPATDLLAEAVNEIKDQSLSPVEKMKVASGLLELHEKHASSIEANPNKLARSDVLQHKLNKINLTLRTLNYATLLPHKVNQRISELQDIQQTLTQQLLGTKSSR